MICIGNTWNDILGWIGFPCKKQFRFYDSVTDERTCWRRYFIFWSLFPFVSQVVSCSSPTSATSPLFTITPTNFLAFLSHFFTPTYSPPFAPLLCSRQNLDKRAFFKFGGAPLVHDFIAWLTDTSSLTRDSPFHSSRGYWMSSFSLCRPERLVYNQHLGCSFIKACQSPGASCWPLSDKWYVLVTLTRVSAALLCPRSCVGPHNAHLDGLSWRWSEK